MPDFLDAAKDIISGQDPTKKTKVPQDDRIDRIDQCKVIWYQWEFELSTDSKVAFGLESLLPNPTANIMLSKARSYDISNHIESFSFNKSMGNAGGGFSLVLHNSFDWIRFMRPGQWICIYLSKDGDLPLPIEGETSSNGVETLVDFAAGAGKLLEAVPGSGAMLPVPPAPLPPGPDIDDSALSKLRCLGIIQRVGIRSAPSADGTIEITYAVTGKDFGTVYDETEIWFNANNAEQATFVKAIQSVSDDFVKNLTELLKKYHDIFLNPKSLLASNLASVTSFFPQQWLLPDKLVQDLGLSFEFGESGFFGSIESLKEFSPTIFENSNPMPLAGIQGRAWDRLKSLSQPEFHELFTELSDSGQPKIYFRPIPWATDTSRYPTLGKVMLKYKDLASRKNVPPPLPVNTNITSVIKSLSDEAINSLKAAAGAQDDVRTYHCVDVTAAEIESFDLGPDYHSRANFFLVDSMKGAYDSVNSFALLAGQQKAVWPLRDENDIKRYGFKPLFVNLVTFNITNKNFFTAAFGNTPAQSFYVEVNELIRDFYANAEDFFSGTMTLAGGRNDVKLGKVILTDETFQGISDMVFYIEGYADNFIVNPDGTTSWTQVLNLTRGMQLAALNGENTKSRQRTKAQTFHPFNKATEGGLISSVKDRIKNPFNS